MARVSETSTSLSSSCHLIGVCPGVQVGDGILGVGVGVGICSICVGVGGVTQGLVLILALNQCLNASPCILHCAQGQITGSIKDVPCTLTPNPDINPSPASPCVSQKVANV